MKRVEPKRLFDPEEVAKNSPIHDIKKVEGAEKRKFKPNISKMTKVIRFLKKPVAILIGAVTGGGSLFAGLDVEYAVLVGASAFLLIAGVELETIKQWKEMLDEDN